jgi:hypothetical protein
MYSVFASTRAILRKYGPAIAEPKPSGQYNFGFLAVTILNSCLRPLLAHWHPALADWESTRPTNVSSADHEQAWPNAQSLRVELETTRQALVDYAAVLAIACGVPNLLDTIPEPPTSGTGGQAMPPPQP